MTEHRQIDYAAHYKKWHDHSDPAYIDKMDRYFFDTLRNVLPADKNAPILELGLSLIHIFRNAWIPFAHSRSLTLKLSA